MSEIEITLPTVQFGNVKVKATPEELGWVLEDASQVGVAAAVYLNLFTQGFKVGAAIDVGAPASASQGEVAERVQAKVDAHEAAVNEIEKGLGAVTELSDEELTDLGAAAAGEFKAPWTEKVDTPKKPWETDDVPAPAVLDASW